MDIIISREEIKEYEKLKIISELTLVNQRIQLLETNYHCTFDEFKAQIEAETEEKYTHWDDYIEWKAYNEKKKDLVKKMDQIANVQDIKIIENT